MEHLLDLVPIIIVAALTVALVFSIKFLPEEERLVEVAPGKDSHLKGPGVVLAVPGRTPVRARVALGDRGTFLGDSIVNINGASFPAVLESEIEKGDLVTIISFRGDRVHVVKT